MVRQAARQGVFVRFFSAFVLMLALLGWVAAGPVQAAPLFQADSYSYAADSYKDSIAKLAKTMKKSAPQLQEELKAAISSDNARNTAVVVEQFIALAPNDGAMWKRLADLLLVAEPFNSQDGYELPYKALGASIRAYQLAKTPQEQADALNDVAQALVKREDWRPALNAYRASLDLVNNAEIREAYEEVRKDHGFRITDYTVESDAPQPRLCFQFSDPLSNAVADYAPYFTQEPGPVSAVTVDGTKLCVEGLKHGGRYKVTVRQGLPSAVDESLLKNADYEIYVRDRLPSVQFVGKSYVLPRTGQNGIPLVSVNSTQAKLALYRVGDRSLISAVIDSNFLDQIYGSQASEIARTKGKKVWEGTMDLTSTPNQDVTTAFPVDEALGKIEPGLYVMTAQPGEVKEDEDNQLATQWFVVSDLGLSTLKGKDGLHVFLRSIASAEPLANVTVRLLARNNEILGSVKTGADGAAFFDAGLTKGNEGQEPALVVASDDKSDYAFIDLTQQAFDLTDRGVTGRDPPGPADAFVYVERGVYRRGETVHAAILLRDGNANALADVPVTMVVQRPDGVEYSRTVLKDQGAGGRTADIAIIPSAASGTWRVVAYTDPKAAPVGETTFLVEDYVPDRIEFDLATSGTRIDRTSGANLKVDGRYLFGAPAAGLDIEGDVSVSTDSQPFSQWKNYAFGLSDENVDTVQNTVDDLAQTDDKGHAEFTVPLPQLPTTTRPLKANFVIRMKEGGGRGVVRSASLPIASTGPMLALKPGFAEGTVPEGQQALFDAIAVDPQGNQVAAKGATWTLKRLTTTYQWYKSNNRWNYEAVTTARKVGGGTVDLLADKPAQISAQVQWGQYRLEISADGLASSSSSFYAGYYTSEKADTPDMLPVALDQTSVKTGDTLQVKIDARFAGKASVQVVGEKLLSSTLVDVPEKGTTVPVTVGKDWGTGAYVVVTHFRPMDVAAKRMPTRAIGLAWFGIDRNERTLKVTLTPTELMRPRQPLKVPVKVEGLAGEKAYVTLAAVDVGILNLTGYKPPEPETFYYSQKRLSAELHDLYGQLIDGMEGAKGRIRTGGDGGANFNSPPPTQAPLALFSGMVEVGADGTAEISFDIPAFNGLVRVMAVAWTPTKVGHASADVKVRDPVVIAGTLPRFLAVGDQSRFRLDLVNAEAAPGDYTLAVTMEGPIGAQPSALYQTVKIGAAGSRTPVNIPITANGIGTGKLVATLAGPGNVAIDQSFTLGVLPANPPVTRRTIQTIAANGGGITVNADLVAEMVPGTGAVSLSVGPFSALDVPGLLRDLDRYPYGCSEQLVSRALPLLYLSELGGNAIDLDGTVKERLGDTVQRLLARQDSNGAFGLWNADSGELWLSAYVTDFLLRAREKGFAVPELALNQAVDYLRNRVGNAPDVEEGKGEDIAYALYTLARAGRAPAGDLKYLADTKIGQFGSAMARAQIAAALGMLGDKPRAGEAFGSAAEALQKETSDTSLAYRNYGSPLRDAAAVVALAGDNNASLPVIKTALKVITDARSKSRYASTQEMTWMVLAARSVADQARSLKLIADGSEQQGAFYKVYRGEALKAPHSVSNPGASALQAVVAVSGSPVVPEPAGNNGMNLTRDYFSLDGKAVDPAEVKQNTRLVVVLSASRSGDNQTGNFLLVDRLPAGFEIENPNLVVTGETGSMSWLKDLTEVTHSEFRDDRFVAAFTDQAAKVAYVVRAVAPGRYILPGTTVEDMYQPERNATLATGTLSVTEK
ncbi:alpha-2-macroglobulin [Labrys sp. ZIDIC5]|uniref:alpha-2-macroglobulin family protein n=1 Tax=Labrys sedimenti TaxID=3106036 RepID=UPI002ACA1F5A|nr:alpha-2-macroglobulin [Labrys sp. ZIDIC5]MDZ5448005.1 alpha-2-macroglobulin [Labrys sp. ZIDIC5]